MAQSEEYKDLRWLPPRSWRNANRDSVQLIVMHTTQGSFRRGSAVDGALYNQRRTDGTSAHYFVDAWEIVHCVLTADVAFCARRQGNARGIQYEMCGRAEWSRSTWLDEEYGLPMMRLAAAQAAKDAKRWGIPARWLSAAQVRSGMKGFCGHKEITDAFPEDNGTHWDPGTNFPRDVFINMVKAAMNPQEDDVTEEQFKQWLVEGLRNAKAISDTDVLRIGSEVQARIAPVLAEVKSDVDEALRLVKAGESGDNVDFAAIRDSLTKIQEKVSAPVAEPVSS